MTGREVFINILEIQKPELDAQLIAESVAMQLEKRVAFRRAMRKAVESALRFGARGIKVRVSGRLNGAEIARSGVVSARPAAAADAARGHRLRVRGSVHDLRRDRRQGVALQGRAADAARRPRRRVPAAGRRGAKASRRRNEAESRTAEKRVFELRVQRVRVDRMGCCHVDAEESQVPQAAARAHARAGVARVDGGVRRLRADGARAVLADRPPDRGGARRADARHQARRQGVDSRVSGQADHEEAAGNAHGQGQGRARRAGWPWSSRAASCSRWKA